LSKFLLVTLKRIVLIDEQPYLWEYVKFNLLLRNKDNNHAQVFISKHTMTIKLITNDSCLVVRKDFMLSPGELEMEVTLDKQLYHHGEKIAINLCIRNHSNKTVKKIKAMVQQGVDVVLFQNGQYRNTIACLETAEGKSD
jgi:Arrestin (or S-antigen), C-terminal domain